VREEARGHPCIFGAGSLRLRSLLRCNLLKPSMLFHKLVVRSSLNLGERRTKKGGERTENAGHDGDARVLDRALWVVHAEGLQGGKTNGFVTADHCCGFFVGSEDRDELTTTATGRLGSASRCDAGDGVESLEEGHVWAVKG
jgi:hypothetical protein